MKHQCPKLAESVIFIIKFTRLHTLSGARVIRAALSVWVVNVAGL